MLLLLLTFTYNPGIVIDGELIRCVFVFSGDMSFLWKATLKGSAGGKNPCHLCLCPKGAFGDMKIPLCGFCETVSCIIISKCKFVLDL